MCPSIPTVLARRALPLAMLVLVSACGSEAPPEAPAVQALIEAWPQVTIEQAQPPAQAPPRTEIRFDGAGGSGAHPPTVTWKALQGIEDLRVVDGKLVGRTTTEAPVLMLETTIPLGGDKAEGDTGETHPADELWSASLTVQADRGTRTGLHPLLEPGPPLPVVLARRDEWPLTSPLVAGPEAQTYSKDLDQVFLFEMPMATTAVQRILVSPTDEAGASFALESVRLVFRREHLATLQGGPGWHGLGEVFRETLVSRSPETLVFEVTLPESPWLDLAVGTVAAPAPTFRVAVATEEGPEQVVAELQAETPDRWSSHRLDLAPWSGRRVQLRLSAASPKPGALALWGHPAVRGSVSESTERPQTVIVFLADTLRRDHLDAWGYGRETAPTLSHLAAEGTRFEDAIAQATWTKASVPSILTSLYPSTTGVHEINDRISAAETTLAEAFRAAGYATFATSSVPFSGQLTNLHQGVEVMYETGALDHMEGGDDGPFQSKTAAAWVSTYLRWLEQHRDVPTFAFIHTMDPHMPFRPRAPFDETWTQPGDAERFEQQAEAVRPHIESPLFQRFMAPSREELITAGVDPGSFVTHEKNWYDGSIRGLDDQVKRLVDSLQEMGLAERTLLAFCADHGEEFLEHGNHWHGLTAYGEVANVPLVLWGQGVPRGQVVEATVQNLDILPTLLDLSGLPIPERAQGRSLRPLLDQVAAPSAGASEARPLPAFTERRRQLETLGDADTFAMVEGPWKVVWHHDPIADSSRYELYDHQQDPLNLKDVAADHPEILPPLAEKLQRWRSHAEGARLDPDQATADLSAEDLERLRSLGYVE